MTDPQPSAAPPAAGEQTPDQEDTGGGWGRALDAAGVLAGVILVVIVVDIFSDGRLISRRLRRDPDPEQAAPDPENSPG
jgi:hypothetical protein